MAKMMRFSAVLSLYFLLASSLDRSREIKKLFDFIVLSDDDNKAKATSQDICGNLKNKYTVYKDKESVFSP